VHFLSIDCNAALTSHARHLQMTLIINYHEYNMTANDQIYFFWSYLLLSLIAYIFGVLRQTYFCVTKWLITWLMLT